MMRTMLVFSGLLLLLCSCATNTARVSGKQLPDYGKVEYLVKWESLEVVPAERTEAARKLLESQFVAMTGFFHPDFLEINMPDGKFVDKSNSESFAVKGKCMVYDRTKSDKLNDSLYFKNCGCISNNGTRFSFKNEKGELDIYNGSINFFWEKDSVAKPLGDAKKL